MGGLLIARLVLTLSQQRWAVCQYSHCPGHLACACALVKQGWAASAPKASSTASQVPIYVMMIASAMAKMTAAVNEPL